MSVGEDVIRVERPGEIEQVADRTLDEIPAQLVSACPRAKYLY